MFLGIVFSKLNLIRVASILIYNNLLAFYHGFLPAINNFILFLFFTIFKLKILIRFFPFALCTVYYSAQQVSYLILNLLFMERS